MLLKQRIVVPFALYEIIQSERINLAVSLSEKHSEEKNRYYSIVRNHSEGWIRVAFLSSKNLGKAVPLYEIIRKEGIVAAVPLSAISRSEGTVVAALLSEIIREN